MFHLTLCIRTQTNLNVFTVVVKKAPPVTKAGLKEFLLELIVDADLVGLELNLALFFTHILTQKAISFR